MSLTEREEKAQRLRESVELIYAQKEAEMKFGENPYKKDWLRDAATRHGDELSPLERVLIKRDYYGANFLRSNPDISKKINEEIDEVLQEVAYNAASKLLTTGDF